MELELKHNANDWTPVGEMGLTGLSQTEASQSAGSLKLTYAPELAGAYRFDTPDTLLLRGRDDAADPWIMLFSGTVAASPERSFGTGRAADTAEALDAWNSLSRTAFLVETFVAAAYNKSHVILFRKSDGERMTTGAQVKAALDYAIAKGVAIQYVAADLTAMDVAPPADEQSDLSCAEVILRGMRWQADTFTQFDYSTTPPTLRFLTEAAELTLSITLAEALANAGGLRIKRNDDKALRGVVIYYEIENQIIDGTTQEIQTDSHGATSGPNVLVHTISLGGSYVQNEESSIDVTCVSWPSDWATNLAFVKALFPGNDAYLCEILDAGTSAGTSGYYVTAGYEPGYGITAFASDVWWDIKEKWSLFLGIPDNWNNRYACGEDPWPIATYDRTVRYSLSMLFTSSPSGNYTQTTPIVIPGETVPVGVAEAIYNARRWPLHSGILPREIETIAGVAGPQHNISLQGSLDEYQDMRAPVQLVTRNWFAETEQVQFGYPQQAGARDFVDMLRANRTVNRPLRRTWKT